jgi:hypothetical protein
VFLSQPSVMKPSFMRLPAEDVDYLPKVSSAAE